jgi:hypothetical protein
MKRLAAERLKAQVERLQQELNQRQTDGPLLVPDLKFYLSHWSSLRDWIKGKKGWLAVTMEVIEELDDLKLENQIARDIIRWIEQETYHSGTVRLQKPNETLKKKNPTLAHALYLMNHVKENTWVLTNQESLRLLCLQNQIPVKSHTELKECFSSLQD